MKEMTGGEAVVECLLTHKIETLFCLPGIQNDWFFNALFDHGQKIRVIHTRHEQGAGYMALGYALASGKVGMYSVVPGPGFLNSSAALATAYALNAKVFCLTGQIPSAAIGREQGVLHEINNQLEVLRTLSKWADRAESPSDIARLFSEGIRQMHSGMPRPVGLEIPMDVLQQKAVVDFSSPFPPVYNPPLDENLIEQAAQLLGDSENPMIFVGSGAQDVSEEITKLAEMLQAPVVAYRTGKGILDARHYLSLQQPPAEKYWQKADVVLSVGSNMRIPAQKWAKQHRPKIIRIDVDPRSHMKFLKPEIAITVRAEDALGPLLESLASVGRIRSSRESELKELRAWWDQSVSILEPQLAFLKVIREELGDDGIFVDELTQVGFASRITWPAYHPRTYISTGYQGTLGYGFPTAIGVKVARPDRLVVSIAGDGGFLFNAQELATAVQQQIPVIILLFNNNQYGNVQQMQKNDYGGRVIATDLLNPDFVKLAESFGAQAFRAKSPEDVRHAIRAGASVNVPTLVEIPVGDMPSADRFR
ncbi:MAG: acetolactate synthase [SAR324 cluster bacterium]|nr:acetolactate synthase [SAR324 cluster bacterium]